MEAVLGLLVGAGMLGGTLWGVHAYFRKVHGFRSAGEIGDVVDSLAALPHAADVIGRYMGGPIHPWIEFKGCRYEFDRVAPPADRRRICANELFIEPGLVYARH